MDRINASDFKSRCLAILDEVERTGHAVTILKRGREVAQLVPVVSRATGNPQDSLKGTVRIVGDIVGPLLDAGDWEAEAGA